MNNRYRRRKSSGPRLVVDRRGLRAAENYLLEKEAISRFLPLMTTSSNGIRALKNWIDNISCSVSVVLMDKSPSEIVQSESQISGEKSV